VGIFSGRASPGASSSATVAGPARPCTSMAAISVAKAPSACADFARSSEASA